MTVTPCAWIKKGVSITHTLDRSGRMSSIAAVTDASDDVGVRRVTVITAERDDYIEIGQPSIEQRLWYALEPATVTRR
jgi:hypothetical protein